MNSDMQIFLILLKKIKIFRSLAESRVVKNSLKLSTLNLIFKNLEPFNKFINVLSENNRIDLLEIISFKFTELI